MIDMTQNKYDLNSRQLSHVSAEESLDANFYRHRGLTLHVGIPNAPWECKRNDILHTHFMRLCIIPTNSKKCWCCTVHHGNSEITLCVITRCSRCWVSCTREIVCSSTISIFQTDIDCPVCVIVRLLVFNHLWLQNFIGHYDVFVPRIARFLNEPGQYTGANASVDLRSTMCNCSLGWSHPATNHSKHSSTSHTGIQVVHNTPNMH